MTPTDFLLVWPAICLGLLFALAVAWPLAGALFWADRQRPAVAWTTRAVVLLVVLPGAASAMAAGALVYSQLVGLPR